MSRQKLPSNKYRVQLRQKNFPRFDQVFDTEEQAIAAEEAEMARRNGSTAERGPTMTLSAAAQQYTESASFFDKADKTRYEEKLNLAPVLEKLGEHTLVFLAKNIMLITGYRDKRRQQPSARNPRKKVGPAKVRCELAALSSVFNWAVENQLLSANPVAGIRRGSSPQGRRRFHENEQNNLNSLAANPNVEEAARVIARFLLLCLEIGCRTAELADLPLEDIDMFKTDVLFRDTKNGTDRHVHLTAVALELIGDQMLYATAEGAGRLFWTVGRDGKEKKYNYQPQVNKLKEQGVVKKDFIAYAGRKEWVTRGFENGIPVATMQMNTGHKTLQSIERYKVDARTTDAARDTLDKHSAAMHLQAAQEAIAKLPKGLRELFLERERKKQTD